MSTDREKYWEERLASASSEAEVKELMDTYLRELGIIPQVSL